MVWVYIKSAVRKPRTTRLGGPHCATLHPTPIDPDYGRTTLPGAPNLPAIRKNEKQTSDAARSARVGIPDPERSPTWVGGTVGKTPDDGGRRERRDDNMVVCL